MPEGVCESVFEPICELSPFLVGESGVHTVGLGILEVNLLMRHVEVTTYDDRLFGVESLYICEEVILPPHSIFKSLETVLGIRHIYAHKIKVRHLKCDYPSLVIVLFYSDAVCDIHGLVPCEDSRSRIPFLFGIVPIGGISFKFKVELTRLHLCFLQTEEVGVELLEHVGESLSGASP